MTSSGPVRHHRDGERGSASLFAVASLGVLLFVAAALGVVAALFVAHRQAQTAADLSALAAASAVGDPCGQGAVIAVANGARLTDCRIEGREAVVTVEVAGPRWLGQVGDVTAQARAGPG